MVPNTLLVNPQVLYILKCKAEVRLSASEHHVLNMFNKQDIRYVLVVTMFNKQDIRYVLPCGNHGNKQDIRYMLPW